MLFTTNAGAIHRAILVGSNTPKPWEERIAVVAHNELSRDISTDAIPTVQRTTKGDRTRFFINTSDLEAHYPWHLGSEPGEGGCEKLGLVKAWQIHRVPRLLIYEPLGQLPRPSMDRLKAMLFDILSEGATPASTRSRLGRGTIGFAGSPRGRQMVVIVSRTEVNELYRGISIVYLDTPTKKRSAPNNAVEIDAVALEVGQRWALCESIQTISAYGYKFEPIADHQGNTVRLPTAVIDGIRDRIFSTVFFGDNDE